MEKQHTVLIVGAGHLQIELIRQAQAMGLRVIATDGNPHAPGFLKADASSCIDTYDLEGHVRFVERLRDAGIRLDGVATAGADVAPTVAVVAEAAGAPGIPPEVAILTHNKLSVRHALRAHGLDAYQPAYFAFDNTDVYDLPTLDTKSRSVWHRGRQYKLPLVVKPLEQRASRGVTIVVKPDGWHAAIQEATVYGKSILVEEYMRGTEHSVEMIFDADGESIFFNIVDRFFQYDGGFPIEHGHINPSNLPVVLWEEVYNMMCAAARALGVRFGPFKCDILIDEGGNPKILEATARLSGGWDCQYTSPATGRNPIRAVLEIACGLPVTGDFLSRRPGYAACFTVLPKPGKALRIPGGIECFDALGIDWMQCFVQPGDVIEPYKHNAHRPCVFGMKGYEYDTLLSEAIAVAAILKKAFLMEGV